MIDLHQKARAGRTRALCLSRQSRDNVFFEAPVPTPSRQSRTRHTTDRLIGDALSSNPG